MARSYCEIHSIRREKVLKLKNAAERDHSRSSMQDDLQTLQLLPKATAPLKKQHQRDIKVLENQ